MTIEQQTEVMLKPCPFCGGGDEKLSHGIMGMTADHWYAFVECYCGASVQSCPESAAIDLWNTRAASYVEEPETVGSHAGNGGVFDPISALNEPNP